MVSYIHNGLNEYKCIPQKCLYNIALETFTNKKYIKVILYSYLILKKMNERITDS